MNSDPFDYSGMRAVLATMHAKERVIGPVLRDGVGLIVEVPEKFDTDRFGTFSREIERKGSQLDAARAKIEAAFDCTPSATIALASEGSFGPDPHFHMLPFGREIVLLKDRDSGLELVGFDAGSDTNFDHVEVSDASKADAFAKRIGFPEHGLIVMGGVDGKPSPATALVKNIQTRQELGRAVEQMVQLCGSAFLEADMRAHRNPTRMRAIGRAAADLVRRMHSRCPDCNYPGFDVTGRIPGLPCGWCDLPTRVVRYEVLSCARCGREEQRKATERETADPGECANCNP
jgi:hypothetical protein